MGLVRRANRWLVAGGLACTAAVSLAAAHASSGRTVTARAAAVPSSASQAVGPQQSLPSSVLQAPAQAPGPAAPAPAPVVSGGS
jgi:hypothetical protein